MVFVLVRFSFGLVSVFSSVVLVGLGFGLGLVVVWFGLGLVSVFSGVLLVWSWFWSWCGRRLAVCWS